MCESPLQNSGAQGAGPCPASSPPDSQINPASPSGNIHTINSSDNDETLFFDNLTYKKHYFKLSKALSKLEKSFSRVWFLKTCYKLNILPPTTVIKANHNVRFSGTASGTFRDSLRNISVQNLKLGIDEERNSLSLVNVIYIVSKLSYIL